MHIVNSNEEGLESKESEEIIICEALTTFTSPNKNHKKEKQAIKLNSTLQIPITLSNLIQPIILNNDYNNSENNDMLI
ncbi:775_t:CDS:1, partial [Funneliformis mosseae]